MACVQFNQMLMDRKCKGCEEWVGISCFNCSLCHRCHASSKAPYVIATFFLMFVFGGVYTVFHFIAKFW
jgi:hypothetical protein